MSIYYDDSKKEWSKREFALIREDQRGNLNWELNDVKEPDLEKNIPGKEKVNAKALKSRQTAHSKKRNSQCG